MRKYWAYYVSGLSEVGKILSIIKLSFIQDLEYRGDMLLYSLSYAAQPVVYLFVWLAITGSSKSVAMTAGEFAQYYIWLLVVQLWVSAWASQEIAYAIRHGRISPHLLRPIPYLYVHLGANLGSKVLKTLMTLPVVLILTMVLRPLWPQLSGFSWMIFAYTWLLAGVIYFLIDMCVGCLAFWIEETSAIDDLYNIIHSIFSGILIPLALMPPFVRNLATFLPFRYSLSFPMEILLGKLNGSEQLLGIFLQMAFAVVLYLTYNQLWKYGVKRYSAVGN